MSVYRIVCFLLGVAALASVFGCAGFARLQPEERSAQAGMVQELLGKWESYTIYVAIWPGSNPVALLFDSKSDGTTILADEWIKVETHGDVAYWMARLQAGHSPRLFQILGPDGRFYGYFYATVPGLQTQVIDAKTLRIFPVKPPPSPGP